ncbi:MAG: 1,4-alpha-glucan branching protein, partial [Bacteroidetes bacterium]|nr:1,4-alpha-glucan branching protein [Bacteroidota bacterium]
ALRAGDNNVTTHLLQTSAPDKIFSFSRKCGSNEVVVLLNFSGEELLVEITDNEFGGIYKNTFTNTEADFSTNKTVKIYPWSYLVFER